MHLYFSAVYVDRDPLTIYLILARNDLFFSYARPYCPNPCVYKSTNIYKAHLV